MTSLGSTAQWTKRLEHFRDFKTIRNAVISFNCTDRDVCMKLGGGTVTICGRKFKIQPYSKYSHWYYVDLQRLPMMRRMVLSMTARVIGGLRSRSRRVYFNQKTPPKCVMVDPRTPLRNIQFTGQGFTVVHHRLNAYNQHVPPFIKEIKERQSAAKDIKDKKTASKDENAVMAASDSDDNNGSTPPAFEECSYSSDNADMNSFDYFTTSPACNDDGVSNDNVAMASESESDS
ncbi:hypothetical protein PsorP6_016960 [Peronosclerospora sorghi]|uniref:Uncharacterized protein n=1 Tax=Peronosclerospora sorghi TaxID=230839 RepID=A0ACC0WD23_9STRA|nr:hypothetical protein PsorP6_016960 [Peronosclerospora sorghi]